MLSKFKKKCSRLCNIDWQPFIPKSVLCFQEGYSLRFFLNDLTAGLTVGIISLPLAMAFAIGAGVDPERGLYTSVIAGFLISLLGGCRYQIGGPTGAFIVIVYSIIQRHGYEGLAIATLLAGLFLILLGITKCGTLIRFIPYPVTTGFVSGIATVLFTSQIKDFFGLTIVNPSPDFIPRLIQYWQAFPTTNLYACSLGALALFILVYLRKKSKKIPGAIIAIIITGGLTHYFNLPVPTVEKLFGPIPDTLPTPELPFSDIYSLFSKIPDLIPDAITIALLGSIESLLCCVIADTMTGTRHKSNMELIGQGIANIGSIFFGGIPATGAIARTTANIQLQAKTPVAGMIHALTVFLLMFLFAPLAGKVPLSALAAILIVIACVMGEAEHFKQICKGPRSDRIVLLTTYFLTVLIDLTAAAQVGMFLAAFLFLKHMSEKTTLKAYDLLQNEKNTEPVKAPF